MSGVLQSLPRGGWTIRYDCPLRDVPPPLLVELSAQLRAIAEELAAIDGASSVWNIVCSDELHLAVGGWRFAYCVPCRGVVAVCGAHPIPDGGGLPRRA